MLLTVTIHYWMLKTAMEVRNAFATRLPTENNIKYNTWPLHYATTVFGSSVAAINLSNRTVILTNGEHHSVQECIQNLEAIILNIRIEIYLILNLCKMHFI